MAQKYVGPDPFISQAGMRAASTIRSLTTTGPGLQILDLISAAGTAIAIRLGGDTANRLSVRGGGALDWGDGTNPPDTNLYRSAADVLKTDDAFECANLSIGGAPAVAWRHTITPRMLQLIAATHGATRESFILFDPGPTTRYTSANVHIPPGVSAIDIRIQLVTPGFASEAPGATAQFRADMQELSDGTVPVVMGSGGTVGPVLNVPVDTDGAVHTHTLRTGVAVTPGELYAIGVPYVGGNSSHAETIRLFAILIEAV